MMRGPARRERFDAKAILSASRSSEPVIRAEVTGATTTAPNEDPCRNVYGYGDQDDAASKPSEGSSKTPGEFLARIHQENQRVSKRTETMRRRSFIGRVSPTAEDTPEVPISNLEENQRLTRTMRRRSFIANASPPMEGTDTVIQPRSYNPREQQRSRSTETMRRRSSVTEAPSTTEDTSRGHRLHSNSEGNRRLSSLAERRRSFLANTTPPVEVPPEVIHVHSSAAETQRLSSRPETMRRRSLITQDASPMGGTAQVTMPALNQVPPTIEVASGVFVTVRGARETLSAVERDFYCPFQCVCCQQTMLCIQDAEYALCPDCRVVNLLESQDSQAKGVGLGFSMADLALWQVEIVKNLRQAQDRHRACDARNEPLSSY